MSTKFGSKSNAVVKCLIVASFKMLPGVVAEPNVHRTPRPSSVVVANRGDDALQLIRGDVRFVDERDFVPNRAFLEELQ